MPNICTCMICGEKYDLGIEAFKNDMRWDCWGYNKCIIRCHTCGLMFIYPQWSQEELDKLYIGYLNQKDFPWQKQAVRITKYLTKYIKKADYVLELGCGKGENVKYLLDLGYAVKGIDKDPSYCDNKYIINKDYKELKNINNYSFIYAIQLFEHLDDPEEFIKKLLEILTDNGKFLLEFPNLDDPILSLYHVKEFKKFYYIPHHLFFFNRKTTRLLFDKLGVKVKIILLQKYGIINHLRWIIFRVPGNFHPHIPVLDTIYKWILTHIFKVSDTIIVIGEKNNEK